MGDARYIRNASGATILNIPAGEAADVIYTKLGSTPQVWGAYSPGSATGRIQILKAIKQRGAVTLNFWDFTPEVNGAKAISDGYHNVDPYAAFAGGDGLWHNISFQAFLACVGKAMAKNRTAVSYVAIPDVKQDQQTTSSDGLLQSSTTTTITSYVKPHWFFGSAVENGGAQSFATAYTIPGCNAATDPRKCIVQGGVAWVSMKGGNMHEESYMADMQSQTVTGWSFIAQIIFTALISFVAAPYLIQAFPAMAAGGMTATSVAGIAAATYAGVMMISSGGACLTCVQGQWGGSITSGVQAPSAGGFGDPSAAIHGNFVAPGIGGGLQAGQAAMLQQQKPKIWNDNHDPAYMQNNPPMRSGVMTSSGWLANPVR